MITRRIVMNFFVTGLLAGAAAVYSQPQSDKHDIYRATLSGAQEVPAVASPATGTAEVKFNRNTNVLTWAVTYNGLTSTAMAGHIHGPAAPGVSAGPVISFTSVGTQPIKGQATITPQQASDLAAGLWYVNLHTTKNPNGEIRGQLRRHQ